jgi:hypothetical protein
VNRPEPRLGQGAEAAEPLLPLPADPALFDALVADIKASAAVDAFARKRATQILQHGHTPEADLLRTPADIAREAAARLHAFGNYALPFRMNLPAGRVEQCQRYVEVAGGILLSLWSRIQVEVPE